MKNTRGWKANLSKMRKEDEKRMYQLHHTRNALSKIIGIIRSMTSEIDENIEKIRRVYEQ